MRTFGKTENKMKIYLVGGATRDKLMGIKPKDLDYVMVLDEDKVKGLKPEAGFLIMKDWMEREGFTIWLETEAMYTIRAKFPPHYTQKGDADFVLARKEVGYEEGTRRPILELGSLEDDLKRRDFTVNAMAEDEDGNIIDLFNGQKDLKNKVLKTPLDPNITLLDDPLRLLRAFRFAITKEFSLSTGLRYAMENKKVLDKLQVVVSAERIREEVLKMMKHDTVKTLRMFANFEKFSQIDLLEIIFDRGLWLKPTFKNS